MSLRKPSAILLAASALLLAAAPPVLAQGTTQTVAVMRVDVQRLVSAHRASKVIGTNVMNDEKETIGSIDDLLIQTEGSNRVLFAVISAGGFLGVGTKHVVVPFTSLRVAEGGMLLPGATKDELKALPEFAYAR
jgi:hypothetical protein